MPGSTLRTEWERFRASDAGHPLGAGAPSGEPLRHEGESHRGAWMRIIRADPCSYCGADGGTVDHIIPKSESPPGEGHNWLNFTGACNRCNSRKGHKPMWLFMVGRATSRGRHRAVLDAHREHRRAGEPLGHLLGSELDGRR